MKNYLLIMLVKMRSLLFLTIAAIFVAGGEANSIRNRVCVVGAGPSGIFSAKLLVDNIKEFEPIVFEKNWDIGGQWLYTDKVDGDEHGLPLHSAIYKNMRTNGPKETMRCLDYKSIEGESRSCVKHETVFEYLRNYTDDFNLHQYIHFNTLVEKISPIFGRGDKETIKWRVETKNLKNNLRGVTICNSVIVSNGEFSRPSIPKIPGIEHFPGRVIHSQVYRKPEEFANQTVVVLGASFSGQDIAFDISSFAKSVYLSHRHDKLVGEMPSNIIQVPGVVKVNGSTIIFQDGSKITADSFIFCTGYKHEAPFLDASSGLDITNKHIFPLYRQIVNINYPSMGFVGLVPSNGAFCPKFQSQAKFYVKFLQGKLKLPSREVMMKDAVAMSPENLPKYFPSDKWWNYIDQLAMDIGIEPVPDLIRRFAMVWSKFAKNHIYDFRDYSLHISKDGNITVVKAPDA